MEVPEKLVEVINNLPPEPGVYLFKAENGKVLYVGKAVRLSERVPQHFAATEREPRKRALVENTDQIETVVLNSERQALKVEYDLIKQHRPRFNVAYRDDKSYPYIKITTRENYPRVIVTRQRQPEDAHYFGPYTDVGSMRRTLSTLRDIFPYRSCSDKIPPGGDADKFSPCLDYNIKQCEAPCVGKQSQAEYRGMIDRLCQFLRGKYKSVKAYLKEKMNSYSAGHKYEAAAVYRDRLEALQGMMEEVPFVRHTHSADVLGVARVEQVMTVQLFRVRENRIVNKLEFHLTAAAIEPESPLQDFVATYYPSATEIPPLILLSEPLVDEKLMEARLADLAGRKVELRVPQRGEKKELVDSAVRSARLAAKNESLARRRREGDILHGIKQLFDLPDLPRVVEGFDISTHQGRETVGSLVRFLNGEPEKEGYRRFKISVESSEDDYSALEEVIRRRYSRLKREDRDLPELVFVDGGPGQLNVTRRVLRELDCEIPVISLAKGEEKLFVDSPSVIHNLPDDSTILQFFQRIRDEAHRFAINYHRDRRQKGISSGLKEIRGLGDSRVKGLIEKFGSPVRVRQASLEELTTVAGVTEEIARRIKKRAATEDKK